MNDIAIRVENLSKLYRIGRAQQRHDTLRDALVAGLRAPLERLRRDSRGRGRAEDTIWALKDVSYEVKRGEVVGIIGRNGAGKSTLLKILSRITEPTEGRAIINGRVGSLLEVGTGFHPELTGRENIYLSGAILGMKRAEIDRKFDEIVAFSGVEKFIATPVKRYSSGMRVRLGFSVAAHLEPEILLVDEVLAVGDAAFQKKCLGKMESVAHEGRTVLFVSHNMAAVQNLCARSVLLSSGRIAHDGPSQEVVLQYLQETAQPSEADFGIETPRTGTGQARYVKARFLDENGQISSSVPMGSNLTIELEFYTVEPVRHPRFSVRVYTLLGQDVVAWRTQESYGQMPTASDGGIVRLYIRDLNLLPGVYYVALSISDGYETLDYVESALKLEIAPRPVYSTDTYLAFRRGEVMYTPCAWSFDYS